MLRSGLALCARTVSARYEKTERAVIVETWVGLSLNPGDLRPYNDRGY